MARLADIEADALNLLKAGADPGTVFKALTLVYDTTPAVIASQIAESLTTAASCRLVREARSCAVAPPAPTRG